MLFRSCKKMISRELRLSLSRNYIYARSIFYRRGLVINDIRVIMGTTDEFGGNLKVLLKDPEFREKAIAKIENQMNNEISLSMNQLNVLV